ncbi:hypothetical protein KZZ52_00440 [Dactylosporangium sp. AC04546]|uniref:hypothetical protein n=1 Tax=Dactylosporangium sp. AC04546 TaxID=2862460 RepID=UPI001EDE45BB|nr:hypothetical protein [Dactylosporangium sp. AC04546]WVK83957.1 hypothetical protein KZZ52_00440 [Dactylosporangium sp. AC04546]
MTALSGLSDHLRLLKATDVTVTVNAALAAAATCSHSLDRLLSLTELAKVFGDVASAPRPLMGHLSSADVDMIANATSIVRNRELQVTFEDED